MVDITPFYKNRSEMVDKEKENQTDFLEVKSLSTENLINGSNRLKGQPQVRYFPF